MHVQRQYVANHEFWDKYDEYSLGYQHGTILRNQHWIFP